MPDELSGQVVLITGGSRGIGRATVAAFARLGCQVAFCYHSDGQAAEAVCAELRREGGSVRAIQADVGYSEGADRLVSDVLARHGRIDVLVNNAGRWQARKVEEIDDAEWEASLRTNLFSAFYCVRAVLPAMRQAGGGTIVNVASIAGKRGSAYHAHYAAAKGGILALTRSLAREVIAYGVRVNAVCPGRIETDLLLAAANDAAWDRWMAETPIRRLGTAEEVANAIVFLAGPASAYIVGETIQVDGGLIMD